MRRRAEKAAAEERRGLCAYRCGELACPLPGSVALGGAGEAREWWCWLHWEHRPQGHDAEEDLRGVIEDQARLRALRRASPLRERLEAELAGHPEWERGETEPRGAYVERMRALRKALMAKSGVRIMPRGSAGGAPG